MNIVKYPNDILITPTEVFDFNNPPIDPNELVQLMLNEMNNSNGVGLSANQLGLPYRVFVMRGDEYNFAFFNPNIVSYSSEIDVREEGCLSVPGVVVKVPRSKSVRVRFQTPSGAVDTKTFDGISSRVIQHEFDHLNGVLFFNRAHRYHREKAMKGYNYGRS